MKFTSNANETIEKLKTQNVWHEINQYDHYKLIGIKGRNGNTFYWFKVFNDCNFMHFDHSYNWGSGKVSRSMQTWTIAHNTMERLIK